MCKWSLWELEVGNLIFFPSCHWTAPLNPHAQEEKCSQLVTNMEVLRMLQLWTGDLERAEVTHASHIIVSCNCRWLVFLKITLGMKMWCCYFRQQRSEWLMWHHMKSVIKMSVAVITCFPSMKADMTDETTKGVYLNITSLIFGWNY